MSKQFIGLRVDPERQWRRVRAIYALVVVLLSVMVVILAAGGASWTWVPLVMLAGVMAIGSVLHLGWWRAHRRADVALSRDERDGRVRAVGAWTTVHICMALLSAATFITILFVEREHLGIGFVATLCALAIFGGPVWLASVGDEEAEEREGLDRGTRRDRR